MGKQQAGSTKRQYMGIINRILAEKIDFNNTESVILFINQRKGKSGEPLKETTKRNYYIAILALNGKVINEKGDILQLTETSKNIYLKINEEMHEKKLQLENTQEMSSTMRANWFSWNDFLDILNKEIKKYNKTKAESTPHENMYKVQKLILLSLYVFVPPIRLDFADLLIVPKLPNTKAWNYITTRDKKLHLYKFKTVKSVKPQTYDLSGIPSLFDYIAELLRLQRHEDTKVELCYRRFLLLNTLKYKMSRPSLTQYLNEIFNKKVSCTMLRHVYLSERFPVVKNESVADRIALLSIMGHKTLDIQNRYIKIMD